MPRTLSVYHRIGIFCKCLPVSFTFATVFAHSPQKNSPPTSRPERHNGLLPLYFPEANSSVGKRHGKEEISQRFLPACRHPPLANLPPHFVVHPPVAIGTTCRSLGVRPLISLLLFFFRSKIVLFSFRLRTFSVLRIVLQEQALFAILPSSFLSDPKK